MPHQPWRIAFWLSISATLVAIAATIVFLTIIAVALFASEQASKVVAVVAIGLEAISLISLSALSCREASRVVSSDIEASITIARRHRDLLFCIILVSMATAATLATIVWTGIQLDQVPNIINLNPTALLVCVIITFVLSTFGCVAVFTSLVFCRRSNSDVTGLPPPTHSDHTMVMTTRPSTSKSTVSNPFASPVDTISPLFTPTQSFTSLRSSFTIPARKDSTRSTRSASSPPSTSHETSPFDSWDTSSVAPSLRAAIHNHVRSIAPTRPSTKLAPIPGSRPASPAKPLDGPFLPPSPHSPQSPPMSPQPLVSTPTSPTVNTNVCGTVSRSNSQSIQNIHLPPPNPPFANTSQPYKSSSAANSTTSLALSATNPHSQPTSPTLANGSTHTLPRTYSTTSLADSVSHLQLRGAQGLEQENIHPLFRTTSPTPPPGTTHGTIVTAASIGEALGVGVGTPVGSRSRAGSVDSKPSRATSVHSKRSEETLGTLHASGLQRRGSVPGHAGMGLSVITGSNKGASGEGRSPVGSPLARDVIWGDSVRDSMATRSTGTAGSIREEAEPEEETGLVKK